MGLGNRTLWVCAAAQHNASMLLYILIVLCSNDDEHAPGVLSDFQHCLELTATNSSDQHMSVFNSRLKTVLFTQAFTEH